jgi:hypothetical protein
MMTGPFELTDEEKYSIRAARRIALYTAKGFRPSKSMRALSLVTKAENEYNYRFLDFVQPAMQDPIDSANEIVLWLMVFPMHGLQIHVGQRHRELTQGEISELIDFIYRELYPSAYSREYGGGTSEDTAIAGFDSYVEEVRTKIQQSIEGQKVFWVMADMLSNEAKRLFLYYGRQLNALGLDV